MSAFRLAALALVTASCAAAQQPARRVPIDPRPLPPGAVARLGFDRGQHLFARTEIHVAAFAAGGKTLVSTDWTGATNMREFDLWDFATGRRTGTVPVPVGAQYGVDLSPDGRRLAWGGNYGHAKHGVVDVATGEVVWRADGGNLVAFTPHGLVAGSYGAVTTVHDPATGKPLRALSQPGWYANWFAVSRDGSTVVTSSAPGRDLNAAGTFGGKLEVWDVATGKLRRALVDSPNRLDGRHALAVSDDGKWAAYSAGKVLTVADTTTGAARWTLENPGQNHVWEHVAFSPGGDLMLAIRTTYDDLARTHFDLLDAATGRVIRPLDGEGYQFAGGFFSPDGTRVVTNGQGQLFRVWDVATGKMLPEYDGHRTNVTHVAAGGDRVVSADRYYSVCTWAGGDLRGRSDIRYARSMSVTADARTALVTFEGGATVLIDLDTHRRRTLERYRTYRSAVSPDGTRAALHRFGGAIEVVSLPDAKVLHTLTGHTGDVYALAFSADGKRLLTAAKTPEPGPVPLLPKGGRPVIVPDDTVRVWDVAAGKELRKWGRAAGSAAITADGALVLAGCADGKVRRLEVDTGEQLEPLATGAAAVGFVAAGGRWAAATGADGIVVFDPRTGRVGTKLAGQTNLTALGFAADGRRLLTGGADGTILVWATPDP
jgi:WD40 repeat protein